MMGAWSLENEEGNMERAPKDGGDIYFEKYWFTRVDTECAVRSVNKVGEAYTVAAHCHIIDDPNSPQWDITIELEVHGDILHWENVGG
jgi:hypothetical protein